MNLRALVIATLALGIAACLDGESNQQNALQTPAAADWLAGKSRQHMHEHARKLETLTAALAAGDLDAAMTPAYWLSIHHAIDGLPDDLKPHVASMRAAATEVEGARDIDAARDAAVRIAEACDTCHAATGVVPK